MRVMIFIQTIILSSNAQNNLPESGNYFIMVLTDRMALKEVKKAIIPFIVNLPMTSLNLIQTTVKDNSL